MVDFTGQLRESLTCSVLAEKIAGLEALRDLVFIAIAQGVNTLPGEYIRCALFEPVEENGEALLQARHYHGHTPRVEHLRLHMSSVAGRAYAERRSIYVPDAASNPMLEHTTGGSHPVETLLCVPAYGWETGQTDPIGVFSVTSNKPTAFSASDREFIYTCGEIIGLIAFFLRLFELIRRMAARTPEAAAAATESLGPQPPLAIPPADEAEGDGRA
jgi:putative methionine-R-sulfoxide reductase with GAF domain